MLFTIGHLKHMSRCSLCFSRKLYTKSEMASGSLPKSTIPRYDVFWWNSNITRCFRKGDVNTARSYFEEMPYKNLVTWNCMISGYVRNGRVMEAQKIFDIIPSRNVVSWTALLTGYARCGKLEDARNLFDKTPDRNIVCWNSMITGYVNSGRLVEARELFDLMPKKNNVSWAVMISGYLQKRLISEARILFDQIPMIETSSLYNILLSGYVDLGCLQEASDLFAKMHRRDAISWNTMITCYSRSGEMDLARRLFEEMPEKDIISWTTIVRGYLMNGDIQAGRSLFDQMPNRDIVAWNTMIGGYVQNGMLDDALRLFREMPIREDIVSWNTILLGYVEEGDVVNGKLWFEKIPNRNETSWNTLISGCRDEEALVLFSKMIQEGFMPDQGTFTVVISVCGSLVALVWGRMIHLHVIRAGYDNDTMVMSSLITMYSKCGLIADSSLVFDSMSKLDTIAWNAIISAHAYHGLAEESRSLFHMMIEAGFRPDHVTFLGLLSACAHCGLVDEGWKYFESMQKDWKLVPKHEHYSCVVDIIGRSGSVVDAYEFIERIIPLELQSKNTWGTLLGACRVQENLELGEIAAANSVLYSQPLSGGMYVLLSNIYAAKGRFEDVESIRILMKERGVKKELACSWIEIKGNMCPFVYNDKSHPQNDDIYMELENLSIIMEGSN